MKLNDPFGRLERRHQLGYESMRDTLRSNGVNTPQAALEILRQSMKRALKLLAGGLVLLLLVTLALPRAFPVTFCLAILLVVWVVTSTLNGRRYIQRYIDEDLS